MILSQVRPGEFASPVTKLTGLAEKSAELRISFTGLFMVDTYAFFQLVQ